LLLHFPRPRLGADAWLALGVGRLADGVCRFAALVFRLEADGVRLADGVARFAVDVRFADCVGRLEVERLFAVDVRFAVAGPTRLGP
jgi:hypothetical protein